jgi:tyrosyl-tRNA synthetase
MVITMLINLINRGTISNHLPLPDLSSQKVTFYLGIDPTGSLHVGHLLPILLAKKLIAAGHRAIVLIGGATAAIGDPTGKVDARPILSSTEIQKNAAVLESQVRGLLGDVTFVNNLDWFKDLNWFSFLSEFGPHFSMNKMLHMKSVQSRLENGMTFLEFNYSVMQGFDFLKLNQMFGCTVQIGGDDQISNILSGIHLLDSKWKKKVFGITVPLLTDSAGNKFGKTVKGAVFLDPEKTSPFEMFQFWRNVTDEETISLISKLTELDCPKDIIEAKELLAFEMTKVIHGEKIAERCLAEAKALFQSKSSEHLEVIEVIGPIGITQLLAEHGLASSRGEARRLISGNAVRINDELVSDVNLVLGKSNAELVIQKGKKHFIKCRVI